MHTKAMPFAIAMLIGGALLPGGASAADLDAPKRAHVSERKVEKRVVRRAKRAGPVYASAMIRRCTTRVRREWLDERWQLRPAQICPGDVPDPFLAVGDTSIAYDPKPEQPVRFRVVSGY